MQFDIVPAVTTPEIESVRELMLEYAASLGFYEIEAYRHNPIAGTSYLELVL